MKCKECGGEQHPIGEVSVLMLVCDKGHYEFTPAHKKRVIKISYRGIKTKK